MGATVALALQTAVVSAADVPSGRELYHLCIQSKKGDSLDFACDVYIRGFIEGIIAQRVMSTSNGPHICPPQNTGELYVIRSIVEKYIRDHPEQLDNPASIVLALALVRALPCASN
jgi:hypothetical protein